MRIKKLLPALLLTVLLCSCTAGDGGTETVSAAVSEAETVTTTINKYMLVRFWTADELLDSIFYCGGYHSLPLSLEENDSFTLSDGVLTFPDGTYAYAGTDENGEVTALLFAAVSAPPDFSVYGVGFDSVPKDIPDKLGLADSIYGDMDKQITYVFSGGGISELSFTYTDRLLESVYIRL
ncbi:MAG: hypothetical protein J1F11_12220 [Oscillospiraceae bacterium]|nr:hypothetical protein [Oscillospiraceae bacterium]